MRENYSFQGRNNQFYLKETKAKFEQVLSCFVFIETKVFQKYFGERGLPEKRNSVQEFVRTKS